MELTMSYPEKESMSSYLQLQSADGPTLEISLHQSRSNGPFQRSPFDDDNAPPVTSIETYFADLPPCPKDLNITEVRFYSDTLEKPVRFFLESFTILGDEAGQWSLIITDRDYGDPDYALEYYATEQFGQPVRNPAVMHWNHDKEQMTSD